MIFCTFKILSYILLSTNFSYQLIYFSWVRAKPIQPSFEKSDLRCQERARPSSSNSPNGSCANDRTETSNETESFFRFLAFLPNWRRQVMLKTRPNSFRIYSGQWSMCSGDLISFKTKRKNVPQDGTLLDWNVNYYL